MTVTIPLDAFHPTTACCIEALQWLATRGAAARVLDMGCGDGILSAMAAHFWPGCTVLAADISAQAVADTATMAAARGFAIWAVRSDGFSAQEIAAGGPYDLIIINLLAEPILAFAPQVRAQTTPGGRVLLSGILQWLEAEVTAAYAALGFSVEKRLTAGPWVTLALTTRTSPAADTPPIA